MKKVTYEVSFTLRQLKKIEERINSTIDAYLIKNPESIVSEKEKEHLVGQAKDQLTVFIQSLSGTNEKWSMAHKKIPIVVQAPKSKHKKDLMSALGPQIEDKFYKQKGSWYLYDGETTEGFTYQNFVKELYNEIYEGASTAAFYAIDSFVAVKEKFGNGI